MFHNSVGEYKALCGCPLLPTGRHTFLEGALIMTAPVKVFLALNRDPLCLSINGAQSEPRRRNMFSSISNSAFCMTNQTMGN